MVIPPNAMISELLFIIIQWGRGREGTEEPRMVMSLWLLYLGAGSEVGWNLGTSAAVLTPGHTSPPATKQKETG